MKIWGEMQGREGNDQILYYNIEYEHIGDNSNLSHIGTAFVPKTGSQNFFICSVAGGIFAAFVPIFAGSRVGDDSLCQICTGWRRL